MGVPDDELDDEDELAPDELDDDALDDEVMPEELDALTPELPPLDPLDEDEEVSVGTATSVPEQAASATDVPPNATIAQTPRIFMQASLSGNASVARSGGSARALRRRPTYPEIGLGQRELSLFSLPPACAEGVLPAST